MGRSASCFKIITCSSDDVERDELEAPENKGSSDRRGWSFRKRSGRHRVLSNAATSENPSYENKESSESAMISIQAPEDPTIPQKVHWSDEKPQSPEIVDSKALDIEVSAEGKREFDTNLGNNLIVDSLDESLVIVIQTTVRGILAQAALLRLKNLVKLQAAVRGHLVRRHAVGSLRCVQAIVKMQALVRARHARLSPGAYTEGSLVKENCGENEKDHSLNISDGRPTSMEKLLSNGFARQLLEANPKAKQIHIKCDPSRPNSAWKWLERWMPVSSSKHADHVEPAVNFQLEKQTESEQHPVLMAAEKSENMKLCTDELATPLEKEPAAIKPCIVDSEIQVEDAEESLIAYDAENFEFQAAALVSSSVYNNLEEPAKTAVTSDVKKTSVSISSSLELLCSENADICNAKATSIIDGNNVEEAWPGNADISNVKENSASVSNNLEQPWPENTGNFNVRANSAERGCLNLKRQSAEKQSGRSIKRCAPEQLENEGKKFVSGPKKVSNSPRFIAAQSKFEDLSTAVDSDRSMSSTYQDAGVEKDCGTVSPVANAVSRTMELTPEENSAPQIPKAQVGGSECGTELSVTSTLDSPAISESGGLEYEHEDKVSEEKVHDHSSSNNLCTGSQNLASNPESDSSNCHVVQAGEVGKFNGVIANSDTELDSNQVRHMPDGVSDLQVELGSPTGLQVGRSSPEASPRSHITVPESQGTPASEVSVNGKRRKGEKSGSNSKNRLSNKSRPLPAGKKSPSNPTHDSCFISSAEQLSKDQKSGKRRSSFGYTKADNVEEEPRDSSSNNSLPSYMQPTESAKAKAHLTNSPRSSPDMQDKDMFIKKRHSLPGGANGRHESPRIQRSMSQAQGTKGNGSHSPHERKWQR